MPSKLRAFKNPNSITHSSATTLASSSCISFITACTDPPVANKSSTISTLSFLAIAFLCNSNVFVPYSKS